jgi:hypothetical protein
MTDETLSVDVPEFTGTAAQQARQAAKVVGDIREADPSPPPEEETDSAPPPVRRRIPGADPLLLEDANKALRRDRELDGEDPYHRVTKDAIERLHARAARRTPARMLPAAV